MFDWDDTPTPEGWTPSHAVVEALDDTNRAVSASQRRLLALIADADRAEAWRDSGARDMAHWVSIRYGVSWWKASRWIHAAHALEGLPRVSEALESGQLGLDKVVELARFATPASEADLVRWAACVSVGAVRERGDLSARRSREELVDPEQTRTLSWSWFDDGRRFGLHAELPAAQGAIVAGTLEHLAGQIPAMPGEEDRSFADARRADALVALCSAGGASDAGDRRPLVVIHAQLQRLEEGSGGCQLERGPVIHPDTVRRMLCNATVQTIAEDGVGGAIGVGRASREPPAWMLRQIRYRDRECRFPSCGARRFTEAHHVRWWRHGGRTDLDNLLLICSFHHRLVHEYGWSVKLGGDGHARWFRPDGEPHHPGPSPPTAARTPKPILALVPG